MLPKGAGADLTENCVPAICASDSAEPSAGFPRKLVPLVLAVGKVG